MVIEKCSIFGHWKVQHLLRVCLGFIRLRFVVFAICFYADFWLFLPSSLSHFNENIWFGWAAGFGSEKFLKGVKGKIFFQKVFPLFVPDIAFPALLISIVFFFALLLKKMFFSHKRAKSFWKGAWGKAFFQKGVPQIFSFFGPFEISRPCTWYVIIHERMGQPRRDELDLTA